MSREDNVLYDDSSSIYEREAENVSKNHIESIVNPELKLLQQFLENSDFIIVKNGDPRTNIVDRMKNHKYAIPDNKIDQFLTLLENCRKAGIVTAYVEKQSANSGFMFDFDIYQDSEESKLTEDIYRHLICEILKKIIQMLDVQEKIISTYVCIIRKPNLSYKEEKKCFKDGFHILIPGIRTTKDNRKFIMQKIIESSIAEDVFEDVKPANIKGPVSDKKYCRSDYFDINSAHVPVAFVGNLARPDSQLHKIENVFKVTITRSNGGSLSANTEKAAYNTFNMVAEFSLNFSSKNPQVRRNIYSLNPLFNDQIIEFSKNKHEIKEEDIPERTFDPKQREINDLVNILDAKRTELYQDWFNVLCALADEGFYTFQEIARNFSKKSKKFSESDFMQKWTTICSSKRSTRGFTISSIYYWAKQDNPVKFQEIIKHGFIELVRRLIFDKICIGKLSDYHFAKIMHFIFKDKYISDNPGDGSKDDIWYEFITEEDKDYQDGELYKWRSLPPKKIPASMIRHISENLPKRFEDIINKIEDQQNKEKNAILVSYYSTVLKNFRASCASSLFLHTRKKGICNEMESLFNTRGFANRLDKDPMLFGVRNGVLVLSNDVANGPKLISGRHNFRIMRYSPVDYIPFNPYDEETKEMLFALRNTFPDDQPDTYNFVMKYFASSLDGRSKVQLLVTMLGGGSNGKTTLAMLIKAVLGEHYGVKIDSNFLVERKHNSDSASPNTQMLQHARMAIYSETDQGQTLNESRLKEILGGEKISSRGLFKDPVAFKPNCNHFLTSNYEPRITGNDWGIWRRLLVIFLKISFIDVNDKRRKRDPNNPFERDANPKILNNWTEDPNIQAKFLGYLAWEHYQLNIAYKGDIYAVPHHNIAKETRNYRERQNAITRFLIQRCVRTVDEKEEYFLANQLHIYVTWYTANLGVNNNQIAMTLTNDVLITELSNSAIKTNIKQSRQGLLMIGIRFMENNNDRKEGETHFIKDENKEEIEHCVIQSETTDQFYTRICREYDKVKHLFV